MRVCVFVETIEFFKYICAGRQLSKNLFPHLSLLQHWLQLKLTWAVNPILLEKLINNEIA